ncbi:hypothetical protein J0S82_008850 [Galemys pyrenaicus]|uniref:Uncharacterized protein n=1 Tax=Galemys pyrenaicus TaxID=202257 RepID=A0A8J6DRQ5_GALPY|nr:hypothetical protein J0S82_008850 [Galemys pyrenaicus]
MKVVDPFSKKGWYDMKTPATFNISNIRNEPKLYLITSKVTFLGDSYRFITIYIHIDVKTTDSYLPFYVDFTKKCKNQTSYIWRQQVCQNQKKVIENITQEV